MKKSQLKEFIKSSLKEENKEGSIKLKKGTSDSEIKKYTSKGIDVELDELMNNASAEARARDIEQSDREYIDMMKQRDKIAKELYNKSYKELKHNERERVARKRHSISETKRTIHPVQMQQMIKHTKEDNKNKVKKSELKEFIKNALNEDSHLEQPDKEFDKLYSIVQSLLKIFDKPEGKYKEKQNFLYKFFKSININPSQDTDKVIQDIVNKMSAKEFKQKLTNWKKSNQNINEQEDEEIEDTWNKPEKDDSPSETDLDKQARQAAKASKGKGKKLDFVIKELDALKKEMISLAKQWKESEEPEKSKLMDKLKKKQLMRNELESEKEKLASKMV